MAKRNPPKKKTSTHSEAYRKKLAAVKTAVPLLLTMILLGVVYVFVLFPESPAALLKRSVLNSLDSDKQQSYRYDGTFGDTNRGIRGEYAGQKSSTGYTQFEIKLRNDTLSTGIETINLQDKSYVRIDGMENLNTILAGITGVKEPSSDVTSLLMSLQGKWIELNPEARNLMLGGVSCLNQLPGIGQGAVVNPMTDENYPIEIVLGPYTNKDDTVDKVYDIKLKDNAEASGPPLEFANLVNCLEAEYGEDDFRLRDSTQADVLSAKTTITIDPISNTVRKLVVKQVGQYFQLLMRDYNKDVSISAPEGAQTLVQVYMSLTPEQQATLLSNSSAVDLGTVLQ